MNQAQILLSSLTPPYPAPIISATSRPRIVRATDASFVQDLGERSAFLLTSVQTDGVATVASSVVDINSGSPPHTHLNEDEIILVQSGAFELLVNGELVVAQAGDIAFLARGEAHRLRGLAAEEPNKCFRIMTPGGFEHFMGSWGPLFEHDVPDLQKATDLCRDYGISLFLSDELAPVAIEPQSRFIEAHKRPLRVLGFDLTMLLGARETQGLYSLFRIEGQQGAGLPLHRHENEDQIFLIEAGEVEFTLGDQTVIAHAGDLVWAPRSWKNAFRIASADARLAVFMTPGGFDEFFVECALTELAGESGPDTVEALAEQFGVKFLSAD